MASKAQASAAFLLALNLLFFSMVSATGTCSSAISEKLNLCIDAGSILKVQAGSDCCKLFDQFVTVDIAVCICLALKNVVGIDASLTTLVTTCGKTLPSGFKCAN